MRARVHILFILFESCVGKEEQQAWHVCTYRIFGLFLPPAPLDKCTTFALYWQVFSCVLCCMMHICDYRIRMINLYHPWNRSQMYFIQLFNLRRNYKFLYLPTTARHTYTKQFVTSIVVLTCCSIAFPTQIHVTCGIIRCNLTASEKSPRLCVSPFPSLTSTKYIIFLFQ